MAEQWRAEVEKDLASMDLSDLDPPVQNWTRRALYHWREHRPRMYRALKQQGRLRDAAVSAAQKTVEAMRDLRRRGMEWWMAEEAVREQWVLLPSEEDVPKLGEGHDPLSYLPANPSGGA